MSAFWVKRPSIVLLLEAGRKGVPELIQLDISDVEMEASHCV